MRCFLEIAQTGSFTAAASRLFMTQSSITYTIQQFEEAIGLKLFDRSTRRVSLTVEGERYVPEAQRLIQLFDTSIADLRATAQLQRGEIRIASAISFIEFFLVDIIREFKERHPNIRVSIRDAGAGLVERMVINGEIDLAIAGRFEDRPDLVYTPLLKDRYGAIFDPADPLAQNMDEPLTWDQLDPARFIGLTDDTSIALHIKRCAPDFIKATRDEAKYSSTTTLFPILKIPGKYSLVPALTAASGSVQGLRFRLLDKPTTHRELCVVSRQLSTASPAAAAFLECIQTKLRSSTLPPGVMLPDA
nr:MULTISPECIES: LysR family transcriptional regulator [unclassified Bordetella]